MARCALCTREVARTSRHHLIPKSEGGTETVDLCAACHKTLHSFFRNRTLAKEFQTIEALQQEPSIAAYLRWIRKQPDSVIRIRERREKR